MPRVRARNSGRGRRWCWTLNNFNSDEVVAIKEIDCRYLIFQEERGENDTPHLQGYVEFQTSMRFNAVKRLLGDRAHIEQAQGSPQQNKEYCSKEGGTNLFEKGTLSSASQGRRKDIDRLIESVIEDPMQSPMTLAQNHKSTHARYYKYAEFLRRSVLHHRTPKWRDVTTTVFWGPTGVGKSRRVYHEADDVYKPLITATGQVWFEHYVGQDVLLLDDFRSSQIPVAQFLRLLDGYPETLSVKGGSATANWTNVYITSNVDPEAWYAGETIETLKAVKRRLTTIIHMTEDETQPTQVD